MASPPRPPNAAGDRRVESASPASFKKRASSSAARASLAGTISSWARPRQAPGTIELPGPSSFSPSGKRLSKGMLTPSSPGESQRKARSPGADHSATLPSVMPSIQSPADTTPLPRTTIFVLCICMLGEFVSASTPAIFMFFMVEQFLTGPNGKPDESSVGLWTGYLSATYFLAQFATSLLWASAATKHGRRAVLLAALLGNAVAVTLFGMSTSLGMAFAARAAQGVFNGAVGVARGAVRDVTDSTNEARAYSLLSVCWGLGGIIGPIIGGVLEHPADKFPGLFGRYELLQSYPFVLPCFVAGCVTALGGICCLFLDRDAGPRTGAIRLPSEKDKDVERTPLTPDAGPSRDPRRASTSSYGTAYGFESRLSRRLMSRSSARPSMFTNDRTDAIAIPDQSGFNLAQRLLLANENHVFSVSDLWVQAATREDDDTYSAADFDRDTSVFDEDESRAQSDEEDDRDMFGYDSEFSAVSGVPGRQLRSQTSMASLGVPPSRRGPIGRVAAPPQPSFSTSVRPATGPLSSRRESVLSQRLPAVYNNLGLRDEPAVLPLAMLPEPHTPLEASTPAVGGIPDVSTPLGGLAPIPEGRAATVAASPAEPFPPPVAPVAVESPFKQLPLGLIALYATLALHGTCCDQVFMSFLVTKVPSGGLGLDAAHYAELVSVMCGAQIFWQFWFFPRVGPPRGKLSMVAMFRLGLFCYLPVYLLFPTLRVLLLEHTTWPVFLGMVVLSSCRYLANTCAYTAAMILTNALTPASHLALANGLAQSAASAARFCGPVIGGALWSYSIRDGLADRSWPTNEALGFIITAAICATGLLGSYAIL